MKIPGWEGGAFTLWLLSVLLVTVMPIKAEEIETPRDPERYLTVISDLHIGLGKVDGRWHAYEDFRWPNALEGFLDAVNKRGKGRVDLVIAGDFLELWQVPDDISCDGDGPNLGCTIEEVVRITHRIVNAHSGPGGAFEALKRFSQEADNRITLLPGNHDAALLIPEVWMVVGTALEASSGRVRLAGPDSQGRWISPNGQIVIEHGQQMGLDVNRYKQWPTVVDRESSRMIRVEGELNVQALFNDVERTYPIIDNLSPEVKGAWYRAQDRGVWGSIADVARLLVFTLFETSLEHKVDILGSAPAVEAGQVVWDLDYARGKLGYLLFAESLPKGDLVGQLLLSDSKDQEIVALRARLDDIGQKMDDASLQHMCDQLSIQGNYRCEDPTTGATLNVLVKSRYRVKQDHLIGLLESDKRYRNMGVFIYGHTHQLEAGHSIKVGDDEIMVFNSGAFQRVMDDENYRRRIETVHPGMSPAEGLKRLKLEDDFKPCYSAVVGSLRKNGQDLNLLRWHMPEGGKGRFVEPGNSLCKW
ncbi:metallophosphoesterase [Sedimenticola selenatireducens]|uniref:metallophosphoesterase n=1 Tax=Sedimenticola selenatireducens TaxID=191960 RepID=UPI002AAC3043|nr:metallophosphoesterase [Sedimenticola selenatireducens]